MDIANRGRSSLSVLEESIMEVESAKGYVVDDVDVSIEIERKRPDIDELLEKFEKEEPLSSGQINALIQSGELDMTEQTLKNLFGRMTNVISETMENQAEFSDFETDLPEE